MSFDLLMIGTRLENGLRCTTMVTKINCAIGKWHIETMVNASADVSAPFVCDVIIVSLVCL